ncbi:MAG: class I mannose-6-phosphate isomerase [Candidatus Acidiferrales bacterium]
MTLRPVRLEPRFVPRIWGVRSLAPLFPEKQSLAEPIGEVWLTGNDCKFADGPFAGQKLGDAWPRMSSDWRGHGAGRDKLFPLLVKFIFPEEKLSVQVHPGDEYARKNEAAAGGVGKTEMWYVISARPGAEVRVGLKAGVDRESFRRAIADGSAEECVERVPVQAGDAIFVPAGTVHTIGPGMTICEIQENSDITYRIFDFSRLTPEGQPRALHIEKALEVIRFDKPRGGVTRPVRTRRGALEATHFAACQYFVTEKWDFHAPVFGKTSGDDFDLLIVMGGLGRIRIGDADVEYAPAQTWLLPAALGKYELAPAAPTMLLRTFVPASLEEYRNQLASEGAEEAKISRIIYS